MEPQQTRSIRSRERVLVAARELIEEVGIDRVTLAAVAARAGVAVGTVYTRFADRSHLIEEVIRAWTTGVTAVLAAEREAAGPALDPRASVAELVRLFRRDRAFIRQLIVHAPLHPGIATIVGPWVDGERARLVVGLQAAEGRPDRSDLVATMALATVERAVVHGADDAAWQRLEVDLAALCAELLDPQR